MAHLRTLPGMSQVIPQSINPSGTSYVLVSYRGTGPQLAAALIARGWSADSSGTVVRMSGGAGPPPPVAATAAAAGANTAGHQQPMKSGPDQIALPLDWPQSAGR